MGEICASWAFVGLHHISKTSKLDHQDSIFLGCAHILGLLIERTQRINGKEALKDQLEGAENAIRLLKLVRAEDAKANEKVVAIFASREQNWVSEKKSLNLQIRALRTQLQSLTAKNEETVSNLSYRLTEAECESISKDERFEEETKKRKELELAKKAIGELKEEIQKQGGKRCVLEREFEAGWQKEREFSKQKQENTVAAIKCLDRYSSEELNDELDIQNLRDWVRVETEM